MKVVLDLPSDVWRLVEYIPEESLPSILLDIIRKDIESRSACVADESVRNRNANDISRLIDMVQSLTSSGVPMQTKSENVTKVKTEQKPAIQVVANITQDLDLDDDLLEMMK